MEESYSFKILSKKLLMRFWEFLKRSKGVRLDRESVINYLFFTGKQYEGLPIGECHSSYCLNNHLDHHHQKTLLAAMHACGISMYQTGPKVPNIHLGCVKRGLKSIEEFPDNGDLISIDLSYNRLREIPVIPDGVLYINIRGNKIRSIPDPIPDSLVEIDCYDNPIDDQWVSYLKTKKPDLIVNYKKSIKLNLFRT